MDVGRSVSTLNEFVVLEEAKALLETPGRLPAGREEEETTGFLEMGSFVTVTAFFSSVG